MTTVIEIAGLRKSFRRGGRGRRVAVDGFDMQVEAGEVHGFLGPNGSGKTTTLRALLGLVQADAGQLRVLGRPAPDGLPEVAARLGAIVESPRFFPNFTGRRTLTLLAKAGGVAPARVDAVLEQVGLRGRADDRVSAYSLGMKQRLAVASALLKDPELLILDEPANGLDPAGIREMRELTRQLAAGGVTVLVSSHILAEIQQVCDAVTIITRGRRVAYGPVAEVLAGHDTGEVRVRVDDQDRAAEALRAARMPVADHDGHLIVSAVDDPARITELLAGHGLWVRELTPLTPDLEDVFLQLTGSVAHTPRQVDEPIPHRPGVIDLDTPDGRPVSVGFESTAATPEVRR